MTQNNICISGEDIKEQDIHGIDMKIFNAVNEFYKAFNTRDISLMKKNWLNTDDIYMANPLGGIKRGWEQLHTMYKQIFSRNAKVYVEFYDYSVIQSLDGFCVIGRERGYCEVNGQKLELAIRTSRIYKIIESEYKQVHHHGSIQSPKLLQQYQNLLK